MSTKVFNTRLQLKYAPYSEWSAEANQFTLLAGEIAIVNVPAETGAVVSEPSILFKVGDGEKTFNQLPWASGLAADVYGWAKAENKPEYVASEIAVSDENNYFGNNSVEGVLKEIWETVSEMTGGSGSAGSIASQIANGIAALGAVSAADGNYVSGVKVVDGKLVLDEKALPDYSDTYAAKELEQTVADHIEAVKNYDSRIAAAQNQADKGVADAAAAQATADAAYVLPEGGIEDDLSDVVKASLAKAESALQDHQDISHLATNERVDDIENELSDVSDRVGTIENDYLKAADKTELANATAEVKATADTAKAAIDAFLLEADATEKAIDTLKEIQAELAEGEASAASMLAEINALKAVDNATQAELDAALEVVNENIGKKADQTTVDDITDRVETLEAIDHEAYKSYADQAEADAITAANEYTDDKIAEVNAEVAKKVNAEDLHAVAISGKIEDLEQEVEYIIFNCGTATTLVSDPITE